MLAKRIRVSQSDAGRRNSDGGETALALFHGKPFQAAQRAQANAPAAQGN